MLTDEQIADQDALNHLASIVEYEATHGFRQKADPERYQEDMRRMSAALRRLRQRAEDAELVAWGLFSSFFVQWAAPPFDEWESYRSVRQAYKNGQSAELSPALRAALRQAKAQAERGDGT